MLDLGSQTNIFFWHLHSTQPPTSTPNGKQGMRNALLYLSERDCNVSALLTCAEETSADQSQDCYKSPPQKHSQHNAKPFSPLPYSPQQLDTSPQQPYSSMMIDSTPPGMVMSTLFFCTFLSSGGPASLLQRWRSLHALDLSGDISCCHC